MRVIRDTGTYLSICDCSWKKKGPQHVAFVSGIISTTNRDREIKQSDRVSEVHAKSLLLLLVFVCIFIYFYHLFHSVIFDLILNNKNEYRSQLRAEPVFFD